MSILDLVMGQRPNPTGMTPMQQQQMVMNPPQRPPIERGMPSVVNPGVQPAQDQSFLGKLGGGIVDYLSDPINRKQLALGFNAMRLNPDANFAQALQSQIENAQAMKILSAQGNRTADALEKAGYKELADLVRSNPSLAKDAISALTRAPSSFTEKVEALVNTGVPRDKAITQVIASGGTTVNMPSVGTIPPGYRAEYDGQGRVVSMEPVPGGPVSTETEEKQEGSQQAYAAYTAGIERLSKAFGQANTGSLVGLLPAFTSGDLTFEGIKDVMLQPLKAIFRGKGEGTFTDADALQLMRMLPTRRDTPESAKAKLEAADMIIRAKLNLPLSMEEVAQSESSKEVDYIYDPVTKKLVPRGQ